MSPLRPLVAVLALPGTVTLLVPAWIVWSSAGSTLGWSGLGAWRFVPMAAGAALLGIGLTLMARTITLFARVGRGTLAPWDPPRRLVVRGIYRHVRNPMISGVLCVLLGEALLLGVPRLFGWFALFLLANLIYIPLFEEPGLLRRFGDDYRRYCAHVPRWIPRLRAWQDDTGAHEGASRTE
jgi:protein-S-isoprenylcysteine O-methyltransferase Ste14